MVALQQFLACIHFPRRLLWLCHKSQMSNLLAQHDSSIFQYGCYLLLFGSQGSPGVLGWRDILVVALPALQQIAALQQSVACIHCPWRPLWPCHMSQLSNLLAQCDSSIFQYGCYLLLFGIQGSLGVQGWRDILVVALPALQQMVALQQFVAYIHCHWRLLWPCHMSRLSNLLAQCDSSIFQYGCHLRMFGSQGSLGVQGWRDILVVGLQALPDLVHIQFHHALWEPAQLGDIEHLESFLAIVSMFLMDSQMGYYLEGRALYGLLQMIGKLPSILCGPPVSNKLEAFLIHHPVVWSFVLGNLFLKNCLVMTPMILVNKP